MQVHAKAHGFLVHAESVALASRRLPAYRTYPKGRSAHFIEPARLSNAPQAQFKEPIMRSHVYTFQKLAYLRRKAARRQERRCYYCNRVMTSQAQLRCTAEHLIARSEQGPDSQSNIVAACKFCNSMRHRLFPNLIPPEYAQMVRTLVSTNHWHEHHSAWKSLA